MDLSDKRILVVEDDDMNYIYLSQLFKITKGIYQRAKTGNEALRLVETETFDLVLMDIQLPDISGIEVTKILKEKFPTLAIIAQTASRNSIEIQNAIDAGCNDILIKPFKLDDFKSIIQKVLNI